MGKAKVHSLYVHLSNPSIVTLCGLLDSENLLVTNTRERITCDKCENMVVRQGLFDLITARAEDRRKRANAPLP